MRQGVLFVVTLIALFGHAVASAQQPKGADIELSESVVDLGTLSQDDDKQYIRLSFVSSGDVPLVITEVRTSCSCTTVKHDRKPIQIGRAHV